MSWFSTSQKKQILFNVDGLVDTGFIAIMGPSGGGKTTLLDIISGRIPPHKYSGTVSLNGVPIDPLKLKRVVGYVPQHDVLMGTLTVFENLMFSAELRLPNSLGKKEKKRKVLEIIKLLGLESVKDSKVGTTYIRGISGGERKRLSIGMELITAPSILYLDEPTTGLDSKTALEVIRLLKSLADDRAIVCSIHQPRFKIFQMFDRLLLLSEGKVIFNGNVDVCVQFFQARGYVCETFNNPADFLLDILSEEPSEPIDPAETAESEVASLETRDPVDTGEIIASYTELPSPHVEVFMEKSHSAMLAESFQKSSEHKALLEAIELAKRNTEVVKFPHRVTNGFTQFSILSKRASLNVIRNPQTAFVQVFVMVVFALIVGLIYFQVGTGMSGMQNRAGSLYFLVVNLVFSNLSAIELFLVERKIFQHERGNNYYGTAPYFIAKMLSDFIPLRVIPTFLFGTIVYWMVGYQASLERFLIFQTIIVTTAVCAAAICFLASMFFNVFAVANLLMSLVFVLFMVFGGFLLNVKDIPAYFRWIEYLSIFRYSIEALNINEFVGLNFTCTYTGMAGFDPTKLPSGVKLPKNFTMTPDQPCVRTGESFLQDQNFDPAHLWRNIFILMGMTVGYLILSYIGLWRIGRKGNQ